MHASDLSEDIDEERLAAMQGAAETAVAELNQGSLNQIIIDAGKGKSFQSQQEKLLFWLY